MKAETLNSLVQDMSDDLSTVLRGISFPQLGQRVIIASGRYDKIGSPIEVIVGLGLAQQGLAPQYLLCDKRMSACEVRRCDRDTAEHCSACYANSKSLFEATNLPISWFSEWLQPEDELEFQNILSELPLSQYGDFRFGNIPIGRHAYASTLRYFLRGNLETEEHWQKYREYLQVALTLLRVAERLCDTLEPAAFFISHGVYVTWGVFTDYAVQRGIPVLVYGYGYRKGTILLSKDGSYHETLLSEPDATWRMKLDEKQRQQIQTYLASRMNGGMDWISYNNHASRNPDELRQLLGLPQGQRIYSLFTNITWDAAVIFREAAFKSMEDWLIATIAWAKNHPEIELIIRCHPAEQHVFSEIQDTAKRVIERSYPVLPPNIHLIDAADPVNSYDLSELSDLVLVYTTKVGLEFASRNIPVVVAGEAFYRAKGFTHDPSNPQEYEALLEQSMTKSLATDPERALEYAFYYFFRRYIEIPALQDSGIGSPILALDIASLEQIAEHPSLKLIRRALLERGLAYEDTTHR